MDSFRDDSGLLDALEEERIQRAKWCAWWYENRPDGEGKTNVGIVYQWVQVTANDGKPLATFFCDSQRGSWLGWRWQHYVRGARLILMNRAARPCRLAG